MKRLCLGVVSIILLLSFSGCSNKSDEFVEKSDAENVVLFGKRLIKWDKNGEELNLKYFGTFRSCLEDYKEALDNATDEEKKYILDNFGSSIVDDFVYDTIDGMKMNPEQFYNYFEKLRKEATIIVCNKSKKNLLKFNNIGSIINLLAKCLPSLKN